MAKRRKRSRSRPRRSSNLVTGPCATCGLPLEDGVKVYIWVTLVVAVIGIGCGGYQAYVLTTYQHHKKKPSEAVLSITFICNSLIFGVASIIITVGTVNENRGLCWTWIVIMILSSLSWIAVFIYCTIIDHSELPTTIPAVLVFVGYPSFGIYLILAFITSSRQKRATAEENVLMEIVSSRASASSANPQIPLKLSRASIYSLHDHAYIVGPRLSATSNASSNASKASQKLEHVHPTPFRSSNDSDRAMHHIIEHRLSYYKPYPPRHHKDHPLRKIFETDPLRNSAASSEPPPQGERSGGEARQTSSPTPTEIPNTTDNYTQTEHDSVLSGTNKDSRVEKKEQAYEAKVIPKKPPTKRKSSSKHRVYPFENKPKPRWQ